MAGINYFVITIHDAWTVRRGLRCIGRHGDQVGAAATALELARRDLARGRRARVLCQDYDGRWCETPPRGLGPAADRGRNLIVGPGPRRKGWW